MISKFEGFVSRDLLGCFAVNGCAGRCDHQRLCDHDWYIYIYIQRPAPFWMQYNILFLGWMLNISVYCCRSLQLSCISRFESCTGCLMGVD